MMKVEKLDLLSVGIDVGSSTSHLVFSKLILRRDNTSSSRRFYVAERNIVYEGKIIDTPLLDPKTIDIDKLVEFFKSEYKNAGITPDMVNTGAVIVTGETAKKENANIIVERLSDETGKFVSATAGPNFESMLAAMGSGASVRSRDFKKTVLSVDIGGGTSNLALSVNGDIISTSCVNIGGRLLGVKNNIIWRIDEPAKIIMKELGMKYKIGDFISDEDISKIASTFADILLEVIDGRAENKLTKQLMMTDNIEIQTPVDEIMFSGGVGELIYAKLKNISLSNNGFNDIGYYLADEILKRKDQFNAQLIEPENKIRATVIGAGAYSLSISGSTCYYDETIDFPLRNIPVLNVRADRTKLSIEHIKDEIQRAYDRFDLIEGNELVALYFRDPVRVSYEKLKLFAKAIENALPNSVSRKLLIILIFEKDIGNSVGNVIRRETSIKNNLMALDELNLKEGDWIDIGAPLISGEVFPVTVKSLVFNKN